MRVCHDSYMQFDPAGTAPLVRVRWYFVPRDTPMLGKVTPFGATYTWSEYREFLPGLGEQCDGVHTTRGNRPPPDPRCFPGAVVGTDPQWDAGVAWPWDQGGCPGDPVPAPGPYSCAYSDAYA